MTSDKNIPFTGQDQIQKEFLHYISLSPVSSLIKDLILTYSNDLKPVLFHPPIECFLQNKFPQETTWKSLCLCSAYSIQFQSRFEKSFRQNLHFDWLSKILMIECQRLCGNLFDLEHTFWKTFYQRISAQYYYHTWPKTGLKNESKNVYPHFSVFLLPLDTLKFHQKLSLFHSELLAQSLLAMCRSFYNVEGENLVYQKNLLKNALLYSKDIPLTGYDCWINHYAELIIHSKSENS